jgi:hypothetical protein
MWLVPHRDCDRVSDATKADLQFSTSLTSGSDPFLRYLVPATRRLSPDRRFSRPMHARTDLIDLWVVPPAAGHRSMSGHIGSTVAPRNHPEWYCFANKRLASEPEAIDVQPGNQHGSGSTRACASLCIVRIAGCTATEVRPAHNPGLLDEKAQSVPPHRRMGAVAAGSRGSRGNSAPLVATRHSNLWFASGVRLGAWRRPSRHDSKAA